MTSRRAHTAIADDATAEPGRRHGPQPIGSAVPDTELEEQRNTSFVYATQDTLTVNVADPSGNLKKVKV